MLIRSKAQRLNTRVEDCLGHDPRSEGSERVLSRLAKRSKRAESGDTLIEVLIAIVVIALTVTALLGALITSITSSSTQRSLSEIDSILNSFAQSAQSEIDEPSIFQNCPPNPYQLVSAPMPSNGPVGTSVTVFVTGFGSGVKSVDVGSASATNVATRLTSPGDWTISFAVPSGVSGPETVKVSDGTSTILSPTNFTVGGTAQNITSVSGYSVSISSIQQWDAQQFKWVSSASPSCPQSGSELITASGSAKDGSSGSIGFVATGSVGTTVIVTPSCTTLCSPGPTLGSTERFAASIVPPNNTAPVPIGTVTWSFTAPGSPSPSCLPSMVTPSTGNTGQATCSVSGLKVGTYIVVASYTGTNYGNGVCTSQSGANPGSCGVVNVGPAPTSVSVLSSPNSPVPGTPLKFSATVEATNLVSTDPPPQGQIQWTFGVGSPSGASCVNSSLSGSGDTSSASCTVTAQPGSYSLTATYINAGDGNYVGGSQGTLQPPLTVSKATPTINVTWLPKNPQPGGNFTITVSVTGVAGAPAPSGNATWTVTAPPPGSNPPCPPSFVASAGTTCMVTGATAGSYTVAVNYPGDGAYAAQSSTVPIPVALAPAGSNIQGTPNQPADGRPDNLDQIVYTYNQAMSANSILSGWKGASVGVTAQFSRQNGQFTSLQICTTNSCNTVVNLGTVSLGDPSGNRYLNGGPVNVTATMVMTSPSVITITLTQTVSGLSALSPASLPTTLVWTPSPVATNPALVACSNAQVTESGPSSQRNF